MSILVSGDFHANIANELQIITKFILVNKYGKDVYDSIKFHIILGDGGFFWPGNQAADLANYRELSLRPFPVLCVIGNHEPILGIKNLPEMDIGLGETVYPIQKDPFVAYLKRGKVYTIDSFKVLVLGGALSIDKNNRTPGLSWWENEYWSEKEKQDVFKLLENEHIFDYVFSHTGPQRINKEIFGKESFSYHDKFHDEVALLNDEVDKKITCREWLCGHWHQDKYHYDERMKRGYQYLYYTTKILSK